MSEGVLHPQFDRHDGQPRGGQITAERFISAQYMAEEWKRLWPRLWLFAGLEQDVRQPGDYFVFNLGAESIVVARTEADELAAFYNVCQHRGARVLLNQLGSLAAFVCPYHGWTYASDGTLTVVPDEDRFSQGVPCDERSLTPVRVDTWAGMVWVCMDHDGPTLAEFLGPLPELIEPYRLGDMQLIEDQTVRLDCNWKAVVDNFGELYHVEHIHPQHAKIFDCPRADTELYDRGHTGVFIEGFTVNTRLPIPELPPKHMRAQMRAVGLDPDDYRGRVLDVRRDYQAGRREAAPRLGYDYELLTDEQLSDIVQFNVFPNLIMTIQPDDLLLMRSRPHPSDPDKCFWDKFTSRMLPNEHAGEEAFLSFSAREKFRPDDPDWRPEHDEFDQDDVIAGRKTMTITIDQDIHLIRDVQAGMHSRGFDFAWLNDDESRVRHYHAWLDAYMAEAPIPE